LLWEGLGVSSCIFWGVDLLPVFVRCVFERDGCRVHASAIKHMVDPPQLLHRAIHETLNLLRRPNIHGLRMCRRRYLRSHIFKRRRIDVAQRNRGAERGEINGCCASAKESVVSSRFISRLGSWTVVPDAARRACDEDDLV
jgi:hypothetical protein